MPSPIGHALAGLAIGFAAEPADAESADPAADADARSSHLVGALVAALPDCRSRPSVSGDPSRRQPQHRRHRPADDYRGRRDRVGHWPGAVAVGAAGRRRARLAHPDGLARRDGSLSAAGLEALWPFSHQFYISGWDVFPPTERRVCRFQARSRSTSRALVTRNRDHGPDCRADAGWLRRRRRSRVRLPPEMACSDHPLEQRTRAIFRIAEAVVQHVENGEADVETDEIGQRQRSHRMVHAALHHRVDRFRRADAFQHRDRTPRSASASGCGWR